MQRLSHFNKCSLGYRNQIGNWDTPHQFCSWVILLIDYTLRLLSCCFYQLFCTQNAWVILQWYEEGLWSFCNQTVSSLGLCFGVYEWIQVLLEFQRLQRVLCLSPRCCKGGASPALSAPQPPHQQLWWCDSLMISYLFWHLWLWHFNKSHHRFH